MSVIEEAAVDCQMFVECYSSWQPVGVWHGHLSVQNSHPVEVYSVKLLEQGMQIWIYGTDNFQFLLFLWSSLFGLGREGV